MGHHHHHGCDSPYGDPLMACCCCPCLLVSSIFRMIGRCMFVACYPLLQCFGLDDCRHHHHHHHHKHFYWFLHSMSCPKPCYDPTRFQIFSCVFFVQFFMLKLDVHCLVILVNSFFVLCSSDKDQEKKTKGESVVPIIQLFATTNHKCPNSLFRLLASSLF